MAVLPESLGPISREDIRQGIQVLERYIRYMRERLEFAIGNMVRSTQSMEERVTHRIDGLETQMVYLYDQLEELRRNQESGVKKQEGSEGDGG